MTALTIDAIPHRPPFAFIDTVVQVDDDRIIATRYVDPASDFLRGHYPGEPVMPGVLICEAIFQAGALLIAHRLGGFDPSMGIPVLTRITDARFRRIVRPGETLRLEARLDDAVDRAFHLSGSASVEDALCARVSFACMLAPKDGSA